MERRIDLDIDRDQLAGPLAELTDLTGRYPLRESLWLRLIAVLDRAGSPAEALARYEQLRLRLARELGVEPGPELQRAYAELLAGRPARLDGSPAARVRGSSGGLPSDIGGLVGRSASLAALDRIVDTGAASPIAVVHGPAGVGKTSAELRGAAGRLDAFAAGEPAADLRTVFSWSYRTLGPDAARLFRRLGRWSGPDVTAPTAAALAGVSSRSARLLLAELARVNLVAEHLPGRYAMHDLLRAFAAEPDDDGDAAAPITRLLAFYLATARRTVALLSPGDLRRAAADDPWPAEALDVPDEAAALRWLDAERLNLVAAVRQAESTPGEPERIGPRLAHALFAYFSMRPHWDDWEEINVIAIRVARHLGDRAAQADAGHDAGFVAWLRGRFRDAQACYELSLEIYRALGDRRGEALGLAGLADVHRVLGDESTAVAHYEDSLAICRELADRHGQTRSLGSLGLLYGSQGRPDLAVRCLRESLAIREEFGDRRGQATSLSNLGAFHQRAGQHEEALWHYRRSLRLRREQGDRHGQATSLAGLGAVHQAKQQHTQAMRRQRDAVAIFRELADGQCLAENLRALADTVQALGEIEEAELLRDEADEIFTRLGTASADPAAPAAAAGPARTPAAVSAG